MLQSAYSIFDGKAIFDYDTTISHSGVSMGILARYNPIDGTGIYFGIYENPNNQVNTLFARILAPGSFGDPNATIPAQPPATIASNFASGTPLPNHMRIELVLEGSKWTFNAYDVDVSLTTPALTATGIDSRLILLAGRIWGLQSFAVNAPLDNFELYKTGPNLSAQSDRDNIQTGDTVVYTVSSSGHTSLSNFSDGAGGIFNPTTVTLDAGNAYTHTISYTPVKPGYFTITADSSTSDIFEQRVLVSPYSMNIGLMGDSITEGQSNSYTANALGTGFTTVNAGVSSTKTSDYVGLNPGDRMPGILSTFLANNVELVHIMIGTNDSFSTTAAQYKTNMQTIVDILKDNATTGDQIKNVIISHLIWRDNAATNQAVLDRIAEFNQVVDELVAENHGFALLGDTDAYDWFKNDNKANMTDGLHPNVGLGRETLAGFWATAIRNNIISQANPTHSWVAGDDSFTIGAPTPLTQTIDKHIGQFVGAEVNGAPLTSGTDYILTQGSTKIQLTNAFLATLPVGTYTLTANFFGGVFVNSPFAVLASSTSGGINPGNTGNPKAPNSGLGAPATDSSDSAATTTTTVSVLAAVSTMVFAGYKLSKYMKH